MEKTKCERFYQYNKTNRQTTYKGKAFTHTTIICELEMSIMWT